LAFLAIFRLEKSQLGPFRVTINQNYPLKTEKSACLL
jgi:hypothetical protein